MIQLAEGRTEGFAEGRSDGIAEELEEEPEKIRRICEAAARYAPDYDNEKIYQALHETETEEDVANQV